MQWGIPKTRHKGSTFFPRCRSRWRIRNGVIFSTLKHTDPHTVRGRSTQKDGVRNAYIFRNGSFRELKIAKESNDLPDLARVLPESYQKSNEFSVNRKSRQNVATDDRRTFTNKDKVRRIQTLGNDNKDAMLDCESTESGFHQSEDKRKHKLRSSYVTSILITKLTFAMFLLKLSTLSAAIFLFVSLVLSLLCVGILPRCQQEFFIVLCSIRYQTSISDIDTFTLALDLKS